MTSGTFVGKINHFSKFRFGFESAIVPVDSVKLDAEIINKPCYTGSAAAVVTVKETTWVEPLMMEILLLWLLKLPCLV